MNDEDLIIANDWLQGSIGFLDETLESEYGFKEFIIATHSCDLVSSNFDEIPNIAIIPVRYVEKDQNFFFGKNPRKLQFQLETSTIQLAIKEIAYIPRRFLCVSKPSDKLSYDYCNIFSSWLGRIFNRSAFPTEFNNRFSSSKDPKVKKAYNKLLKFFSHYSAHILNIFIKLNTWGELGEADVYTVDLVLIVPIENKYVIQELNDELDELVNNICDSSFGLEVSNTSALSADQFTIHDILEYKLWSFDHISQKDGTDFAM